MYKLEGNLRNSLRKEGKGEGIEKRREEMKKLRETLQELKHPNEKMEGKK